MENNQARRWTLIDGTIAVDGDLNTCVMIDTDDAWDNPHWIVDLEDMYVINQVDIYQRLLDGYGPDNFIARLSVSLCNTSYFDANSTTSCGSYEGPLDEPMSIQCEAPQLARYLRIKRLAVGIEVDPTPEKFHLCEVVVVGHRRLSVDCDLCLVQTADFCGNGIWCEECQTGFQNPDCREEATIVVSTTDASTPSTSSTSTPLQRNTVTSSTGIMSQMNTLASTTQTDETDDDKRRKGANNDLNIQIMTVIVVVIFIIILVTLIILAICVYVRRYRPQKHDYTVPRSSTLDNPQRQHIEIGYSHYSHLKGNANAEYPNNNVNEEYSNNIAHEECQNISSNEEYPENNAYEDCRESNANMEYPNNNAYEEYHSNNAYEEYRSNNADQEYHSNDAFEEYPNISTNEEHINNNAKEQYLVIVPDYLNMQDVNAIDAIHEKTDSSKHSSFSSLNMSGITAW